MQQKWKSEPLCFLHPEPKKFVKNKLFPQSTKYEARTFVAYFWTSVHGGTAAAEASNSTLGLPQAWKKWSEFFSSLVHSYHYSYCTCGKKEAGLMLMQFFPFLKFACWKSDSYFHTAIRSICWPIFDSWIAFYFATYDFVWKICIMAAKLKWPNSLNSFLIWICDNQSNTYMAK